MYALRSQLLVILVACFPSGSASSAKPNIVFIVADDLGWNDVGFRNPDMITPNIDELARAGVILNSSYVQPVCSPSRSCFMTGLFPYHTGLQDGVIEPSHPGYVPDRFPFLPEKLRKLGYSTHAVGKWHLGFCNWKYTPTYRGFDSFFGSYCGALDHFMHTVFSGYDFRFNESVYEEGRGQYSTYAYAQRAVDIIKSQEDGKPLFLYLPFQNAHNPYQVPEEYEHMYNGTTGSCKYRKTYCAMATILDEAVGNITRALNEKGLMDNLLLVFTTDNGGPIGTNLGNNFPLRGGKNTLWEGGTKGVAFYYSKTLLEKKGYLNTGMIHAVDWFPTFVELAGGEKTNKDIDGVSQLDMIINGGDSKREAFVYNIGDKKKSSAIRYKDLKLTRGRPGDFNNWQGLPTHNVPSNDENKFQFSYYMLFNITEDPTEHVDLSKSHPDLVLMMKEKLADWESSAVPSFRPQTTKDSDPSNFGDNWSPGWC